MSKPDAGSRQLLTGVSVVIPALNEEGAIESTVRTARRALEAAGQTDGEVIIVDDASTDRTADLAAAAGARLVRHPSVAGYGRSIKDGVAAAKHDAIVIADADGTYPLERIPDLLAEYQRGFDMVVGERRGTKQSDSVTKGPMRYVLKYLVEFTVGRSVPDVNSGMRVFSRAVVQSYSQQLCDTFSFTTSLTLAYLMTGRFVAYIPIVYGKRIGRTKVRLFRESLRTLQYIVQAIVYYNPIKIFLLMSGACLGLGGAAIVLTLGFGFSHGHLLALAAILTAILVFSLGLLADLLRQIMSRR